MKIKRILKVSAVIIGMIVVILSIATGLFFYLNPEFGATQPESKIELFDQSGHYSDGVFVNQIPTSLDMSLGKFSTMMKDFILGVPNDKPENPLPVLKVDSLTIASKNDTLVRITWFGHSAFLLEIDGKNILLDPMFGDVPAPHPWLGPKRFTEGLPIEIEKLPRIDAVLFSHDHYDHLDYGSVIKFKDNVDHFFVPLGVGSHLLAWGVEPDKVSEHEWWEEIQFENLKLVCTPARHFSGRAILDRNNTLWASWVINSSNRRIYFSGDSGYGPHFKEIGNKYGPFDFAMLECGQYDLRWEDIHLLPEQTVQAALDLDAKLLMPIHWGAFVLALHSWKDPVERISKRASKFNVPLIIPKIGEQILLNAVQLSDKNWWVNWN